MLGIGIGIPFGLASLEALIAAIFTSPQTGAWFSSSRAISTPWFQNSTGTTPVTAVEQPVGFAVDRSLGAVRGPELISNGSFNTNIAGWTGFNSATPSWVAGQMLISGPVIFPGASQIVTTVASSYVEISVDYTLVGATTEVYINCGITIGSGTTRASRTAQPTLSSGTLRVITLANTASTSVEVLFNAVDGGQVDNITCKSLEGNHATQATAAARPVFGSRVNLLTKTDSFASADWIKAGSLTITDNAALAPDGTMTATLLAPTGTSSSAYQTINSAMNNTLHITAKASGKNFLYLIDATGASSGASFDLISGVVASTAAGHTATIAPTAEGYYICTVKNLTSTYLYFQVGVADSAGSLVTSADAGKGILLWRPQFERGSTATPYQRVNTATDYDTAGFPTFLKYDGVDDSLSSATGGGGTAGFFYTAAIQLNAGGVLQGLISDAVLNGGYRARVLANNTLEFASGGGTPLAPPVANAPTTATTGGTLAAATYLYVITALNAKGESLKSNEVSVATTGTTSTTTTTWGAIAGATSYRIYRGTATGAQNVFYAVGNVTTFTDTGAANTAGAPPTTTDTAFTKLSSAAMTVGSIVVVSVFDDGTNLAVQLGTAAPVTIPRLAVAAGSAGISYRKSNVAAAEFGNMKVFEEIYTRNSGLTADQRLKAQRQVASAAGVVL